MASIAIRDFDDDLKRKLRLRAANRNRSLEDEARDILRTALAQEPADTRNLADAIRELAEPPGAPNSNCRRARLYQSRRISNDRPGHQCSVGAVAAEAVVLPFDGASAQDYARIAAARRRSGRPISEPDARIVAIARSRGAELATRSVADFAGCELEVINPWL